MNRQQALITAMKALERQEDIYRHSPVIILHAEEVEEMQATHRKPYTLVNTQSKQSVIEETRQAMTILNQWLQESEH